MTRCMSELPEHVRRNRARWDAWAAQYAEAGERGWAKAAPDWGIWSVSEEQARMIPPDIAGKDVIELGCGTAYVSSWLARRGARVVGIVNSMLMILCSPEPEGIAATDRLLRPAFGLHRVEWPEDPLSVEFHLTHGDWIRLLRTSGFEIEDLVEVRPDENASTRYNFITLEWARRWPCEEIWKVRKPARR